MVMVIKNQWGNCHCDIVNSKHVIKLYFSLNRNSRGVSPHDDLSIRLICGPKRNRAGRGSQFDWKSIVVG